MRVAIQGTYGSYSECAALEFFPGAQIVPRVEYRELFEAVRKGEADCMVIPIENTTEGSVYQYYDLLLEYAFEPHNFRIAGEHKLKIRHCLIGLPEARLEDITEARSHYQALGQCRQYLSRLRIVPIEVKDTALAVTELRNQGRVTAAAVASAQAASDSGMKVLAAGIQDTADNYTRFLVVQPGPAQARPEAEMIKCSVVFCIPNVEGSLFRAMAAFGTRKDVGVVRIESRPLPGTKTPFHRFIQPHRAGEEAGVWDLLYYLDFLSPAGRVSTVIDHLRDLVLRDDAGDALQVLGACPSGPLLDKTGAPWR